jgi:lipopolysaccharide/colanic/teichoic acid biosynthesis glycosyltransferase
MNKTKRIFDIALASICIVLLSPVILLIVAAMKVLSPGPLLFRQERLGKNGNIFLINKFRKFPADWGSRGPGVTLQGDSRMTNIGQLLERTKLDEIPQLWNILAGEMSFVGPRPESLAFSHLLQGEYSGVLKHTPGLFGPNQIKFRNESAMYPKGVDPVEFYEKQLLPQKAKNDLEYFARATFWSDLSWIARGGFALVFNVVTCKKALMPTALLFTWDIVALGAAWLGAHWLKYSFVRQSGLSENAFSTLATGAMVLPITMILVFAVTRVYRNPIRYFSETDAFRLIGALCVVWIVSAVIFGMIENSTSSLLLSVACLLSTVMTLMPRVVYSNYHSSLERRRISKPAEAKINVLVCGISPQSLQISSMLHYGFGAANVIGLVSPHSTMVRRVVKGFTVLGTYADLDIINTRYGIDQIWFGPNIEKEHRNTVNSWCLRNGMESVSIASQPGFRKLLGAEVAVPEYAEIASAQGYKKSQTEVAA